MFKNKIFKIIIFILAQLIIYFFFISVLSSRLRINTERGLSSWELPNEGSAAFTKSFAASHLYLGLSVTKGQSFFYNGPNEAPRPYLHQPPGLGLAVWMMDHFFGYQGQLEQYWPLFFPLMFQTISFVFIAIITIVMTSSLFLSICATLIFTLLPISIYFGHVTESMIVTLPFVMISVTFYYYYLNKQKIKYLLLLIGATTVSAFFCWTGIYILPVMVVHMLIISKFKPDKKQFKFLAISTLWEVLIVFTLFGQIYWADNFSFNALKDGYDRRILGYTNTKVNIFEFIKICLHHIKEMYTWPVCITAIIFSLANILKKISYKKVSLECQIIFVSLFIGLGPIISLPYISTGHQFWFFCLIPFFLFSSIAVLKYLYKRFTGRLIPFYIIASIYIFGVFLSGKNLIYGYYTNYGMYFPEKGHFVEVFNVWNK